MGNLSSRQRQQPQGSQQPGAAQPPPAYTPGSGMPGQHYPLAFRPQGNYYAFGPPLSSGNTLHPGWRPPVQGPGANSRAPPQAQQPVGAPQAAQELTKTATIRNSVNLKKNTLRLVPLAGDPTKLLITFAFDNSAPCTVSTFSCATEEPSSGCRITSRQPSAPSIQYDKGLGLKFPKPGAEAAHQHVIDLGRHPEASLMAADGNTFPLIIRLETVTERGAKEGHTLQELQPGAAQKQWVQSQTTFATLGKGEDGDFEVRVLKQKIWVDGISYELQEIYGMDQAGGGGAKAELTEAEAEDRLCVICLVNERDTTVLPCRHMCMCHECAQELRKQTQRCPICRNPVESLLHIRLGNKGAAGAVPVGSGGAKGGGVPAVELAPSNAPALTA